MIWIIVIWLNLLRSENGESAFFVFRRENIYLFSFSGEMILIGFRENNFLLNWNDGFEIIICWKL